MQLTTPVSINPSPLRISHETPVLLMGSCFADNIGDKLQKAGFNVLCNPFGTLYNPLSIALALQHALGNREIDNSWLIYADGFWHSWMHHSRFSHTQKETCLSQCNEAIHLAHEQLLKQPVVIITLGTAYVFRLVGDGMAENMKGQTVANCHKLPASFFSRTLLSVQQITATLHSLLSHPLLANTHAIFTVSPIRHMADGAHGNQVSKSTLILSMEELLKQYPNHTYFPSYEIMLDELRDYRYYARDMCHPTDLAIDIIWQRFQETYMTRATQQICLEEEKKARRAQHRPNIKLEIS